MIIMKKQKNKIILMLITTTLFLTYIATNALSEETINLAVLDYQENDIIAINGDITLTYLNSSTGSNDINLLWRIYQSNITIYSIQSKTIMYDTSFINDTKNYYFKDNTSNITYLIQVNYSSIQVPKSIEQLLNESLAIKDAIIQNLSQQLNNSTFNILNLTTFVDMYKTAWELSQAENLPLQTQNANLTLLYENTKNKTSELRTQLYFAEDKVNSLEETTAELRDNWCFSYTYNNKDYGPYLNFPNLLIGLIGGMITAGYITKKVRIGKRKRDIHKNATTDIENPRSTSLIHNVFRTDYGANKRQDVPYGNPKSFQNIDNPTTQKTNTEIIQNTKQDLIQNNDSEKIVETKVIPSNPKDNTLTNIEDKIDNGYLKKV